jgi:hypothetical protein
LYAWDMRTKKKLTREVDCGEKTGAVGVGKGEGKGGEGGEKGERGVEKRGERKKIGRPGIVLSTEDEKTALQAAYLGMPEERVAILCGFADGSGAGWGQWLTRNPEFARRLRTSRVRGEVEMQQRVLEAPNGWQGAAWLLERTRGYVARQQLEHSGPGGKALTIAHQVLAAVQHGERA